MINPQCHRRTNGCGDIIAQSIIPYSFCPTGGIQYVNRHRTISNRNRSKRSTMQGTDHSEQKERSRHKIPCEEEKEQEVTHNKYFFPWETIYDIPTEHTSKQCHNNITRQDRPNHIIINTEPISQINRKQRHQ